MFELKASETFTLTKRGDSSIYVSLNRVEAEHLWAALGLALFPNKGSKWKVNDHIDSGSDEPDLPVGSVIQDHSDYKDRAIRTSNGWQWQTLLGSPSHSEFHWEDWQEQSWTVINVGK